MINFKITRDEGMHIWVEITKEIDALIPAELKHVFAGADYSLCMNDVECKILGADMDNWEHCADWYVVNVK